MTLRQRMLLVGLVVFAVALAGIDSRATYGARVSGDEPQYLLTAISVYEDGNLDIADELAEERYRPFHEVDINTQTRALTDDGQRISPHDPLLPVLLALPMAVGGWASAKAAMAIMAAAAAALTLWLAEQRFGVPWRPSTLTVLAFFVSPPLIVYGTQIYPAMPAALCVLVGLAGITSPRDRTTWVAVGAVIALPWLAVKYLPLAAALALALVLRNERAGGYRTRCLQLVVLALGGVIYLVVHQRVYGGWTVYSTADHFTGGEFEVIGSDPNYVGRSRRLVGLLVDRGFGLVAWGPVSLLAVPAVAAWARSRGVQWGWLPMALIGAGWATATWVALTMHGWWFPGRQVVPLLPLFALLVARLVRGSAWLQAVVAACGLAGLVGWLLLVWETSTDRLTLIVDFENTVGPWHRLVRPLLPDHQRYGTADQWLTIVWVLALLGLAVWGFRRASEEAGRSAQA